MRRIVRHFLETCCGVRVVCVMRTLWLCPSRLPRRCSRTTALPAPVWRRCWAPPTPERPTLRLSGCLLTRRGSSACRCACWRARSTTRSQHGPARMLSRWSPARKKSNRRRRGTGSPPSRRCRAISTCRFWRWMKSRSQPIWSAVTSSPTRSWTGAGATRRCCWGQRPCGRSSSGCCPAPTSWRGRGCRSSNSPATARSRGNRGGRRSSHSPPMKCTPSPSWSGVSMVARPLFWAPCRRAPATRRWRCSSPATSITLLQQMPSAWVSISMSITSPSLPTANTMAISSAAWRLRSSRRSRAVPAAPPAMAPSAPRGAVRRLSRNWSMRCRTTPSTAWRCCNGAIRGWISRHWRRFRCRSRSRRTTRRWPGRRSPRISAFSITPRAMRTSGTWPRALPPLSGCGRPARFPITASCRLPLMPNWSPRCSDFWCERAGFRTTGSRPRLHKLTALTAISTHYRPGSPRFGPGHSRQIVLIGSLTPSAGRQLPAASRINCQMPCMKG